MEEILKSMQDKITALQTQAVCPRKVVVSPNIPISLFINGPGQEDAFYLPAGKVTQIALTLIGPKDAILYLNVVQTGSNITEEIALKLGQVILTRELEIKEWSIVRAKLGTEDLSAKLIIGFNFQPVASYVAEKGVDSERILVGSDQSI